MEHAREMTLVLLVFIKIHQAKLASLAQHIVPVANQKISAQPVSKDFLWLSSVGELSKLLIAHKNVVMAKDLNSTAMTVTAEMEMVVTKTVKSKKDGLVKEVQALRPALVSLMLLQGLLFHWLVLSTYSEEWSKESDFLTFPQLWLPMTVPNAANFSGLELSAQALFLEWESTISPRANTNFWLNSTSTVFSAFQFSLLASKSTLTSLSISPKPISLKLRSRPLILPYWRKLSLQQMQPWHLTKSASTSPMRPLTTSSNDHILLHLTHFSMIFLSINGLNNLCAINASLKTSKSASVYFKSISLSRSLLTESNLSLSSSNSKFILPRNRLSQYFAIIESLLAPSLLVLSKFRAQTVHCYFMNV